VVDTGADFRVQALTHRLQHLDAVFYTHAHTDHIMGFDDLRRFCHAPEKSIPIYAAPETLKNLRRVFDFAFNGENIFPGYVYPEPHEITGPFTFGGLDITPLNLPHGRFTVTGFLFEKNGRKLAAYLSDCNAIPPEVSERVAGVEHFIVDGLRHKPHPTHLTVTQAVEAGRAAAARCTWLTHISHDILHARDEAALPANSKLAYDGLVIEA
jgi:phosphoribosyl 1,2-cyclic phosphate phosphodiesterase